MPGNIAAVPCSQEEFTRRFCCILWLLSCLCLSWGCKQRGTNPLSKIKVNETHPVAVAPALPGASYDPQLPGRVHLFLGWSVEAATKFQAVFLCPESDLRPFLDFVTNSSESVSMREAAAFLHRRSKDEEAFAVASWLSIEFAYSTSYIWEQRSRKVDDVLEQGSVNIMRIHLLDSSIPVAAEELSPKELRSLGVCPSIRRGAGALNAVPDASSR